MRARISAARDRGCYVSVMLFEGWELEFTNAWTFHPFNGPNNVNGVFTDPALDLLPPEKPLHLPASAGEDIEGLRSGKFRDRMVQRYERDDHSLENGPRGRR
jgi:hypothetical protein